MASKYTNLATSAIEPIQAGFAQVDITPPIGWRRTAGYRESISTGIHDPLFAKAVVLKQDSQILVFISNDLGAVSRNQTDPARTAIARRLMITRDNVVITATHTQGGPEYTGPLRDVFHDQALNELDGIDPYESINYQAWLNEKWVEVAEKALSSLTAVNLSFVDVKHFGVAFNRRYRMRDQSIGWLPRPLDPEIIKPLGPTDPELPCLLIHSQQGQPLGCLVSFSLHTSLFTGPTFGACYPATLATSLSAHFDAPDFVTLFAEGCASDVDHVDVSKPLISDRNERSQAIGISLAKSIIDSLEQSQLLNNIKLEIVSGYIETDVRPVRNEEVENAEKVLRNADLEQFSLLEKASAWRVKLQQEYWISYNGRYPLEVQAIGFNKDLALVALPGEVFVELGIAIKAASPFRHTVVVSLANDIDFHVPTRRAFEEGHYEPATCPLMPGCGEQLVELAVKLLHQLKMKDGSQS